MIYYKKFNDNIVNGHTAYPPVPMQGRLITLNLLLLFACRIERDLPTRTDKFGVEMCERLMWDIREGIVGAEKFIPKHSVIVTWKNMSFAGAIQKALHVVRKKGFNSDQIQDLLKFH